MPEKVTIVAPKHIRKSMLAAEHYDSKRKLYDTKAKKYRETIKNDIIESEADEYILEDEDDLILSAHVFNQTTVLYDFEKLKQKLDKRQLKHVTDSILVVNESSFSDFLKQHPELRKELRSFISKVTNLNTRKLDIAFEQGIVTLEDLKGCYTVEERPCFRLQRVKPK